MAAYNFPNSPSDGDTVTSNGITYTYSSSKTRWDGAAASGSSTTVYATIDDLPLSGASTGDQAYVEGNNRLYIWNGTGWYNIALINTTPSISGAASSYLLATDGTATTVTITATDPEGIPITYSIASDTSGNVATVTQGTGANTNVFTITPSTNTANAGTFSLTFRASDGVNIATAVSSFTLEFIVSNSHYTTALITSVGANNAVNNSFDDASTNNHTITASGNVTQGTFSPYRHGGYSTYFDGATGTKLTTPASFNFSGAFTIEFWVNTTAGMSVNTITPNGSDQVYISLSCGSVATYQLRTGASSFTTLTGTTVLNDGLWHHVAFVRNSSGVMSLYVDGVGEGGTATQGANIGTSEVITIGAFHYGLAQYDGWSTGYVRDFRVSSNARYSSNFTVPSEPVSADSNTTLLTCHLPYIADGSSNSYTMGVGGNTRTEPFSPYDYFKYLASNNGGSAYFDGNGDVIYTPQDTSFNFGTGDFTFEAWVYPTAYTSNDWNTIFATGNSTNNGGILIGKSDNNLFVIRQYGVANSVTTSALPTLNTWTHIACVRSSGTSTIYYNGASVASASDTSNYSSTTPFAHVGNTDHSTYSHYWTGYITDVRVVSGTAVYTSAFTPPTASLTAITNTSLLLNGTDAGIIDKSQSVKTITLNGDVKSSTTQSKYLTSSMYFDGTGDSIATNLDDTLPDDFTLECWIYASSAWSNYRTIFDSRISANAADRIFVGAFTTSGEIHFYTTATIIKATNVPDSQWVHFAISRESGTLKMFIDGTLAQSASSITQAFYVPRLIGNSFDGYGWQGYMSDVRITKGLARYTSNFTPPTAALQG